MFVPKFQRQREELGQMTKQERRAEQLMKRVTRDVHRLKRNHPNALTTSFRYVQASYVSWTSLLVSFFYMPPTTPSQKDIKRVYRNHKVVGLSMSDSLWSGVLPQNFTGCIETCYTWSLWSVHVPGVLYVQLSSQS